MIILHKLVSALFGRFVRVTLTHTVFDFPGVFDSGSGIIRLETETKAEIFTVKAISRKMACRQIVKHHGYLPYNEEKEDGYSQTGMVSVNPTSKGAMFFNDREKHTHFVLEDGDTYFVRRRRDTQRRAFHLEPSVIDINHQGE